MPFTFRELDIPGVILIEPKRFEDSRGFFMELYRRSDFYRHGIRDYFVQDNSSRSARGVLRGLHYQKTPHAQGKLVHCTQGEIFDVAVDIRNGSPTYLRWVGVTLSAENNHLLYIPPGFAHGFVVLSESADVTYKCTDEYSPADDRGIIWNDPDVGISWPIVNPILSEKDSRLPLARDADNTFVYAG